MSTPKAPHHASALHAGNTKADPTASPRSTDPDRSSNKRSPGCAATSATFALGVLLVPLLLDAPWWGWLLAALPAGFFGLLAAALLLPDSNAVDGSRRTRRAEQEDVELGPELLEEDASDMDGADVEDDTPLTRAVWRLMDKAAEKIVGRLREPFAQASIQLGKAAHFEVMVLLMYRTSASVPDRLNAAIDSYCRKQLQRMFSDVSAAHDDQDPLFFERWMRYQFAHLHGRSPLPGVEAPDSETDQAGQFLLGRGGGKALRKMMEDRRRLGSPEALLCKYLCGVGVRDAPALLGSLHDFEPPPAHPQLTRVVAAAYGSVAERYDHYLFRLIGNDVVEAMDLTEEQVQERLHNITTEAQSRRGESRQ